jgi:hypothetical protein
MFLMAWIGDGSEELSIAARSADILGRTRVLAVETPDTQTLVRVAGEGIFDDEDMVPSSSDQSSSRVL